MNIVKKGLVLMLTINIMLFSAACTNSASVTQSQSETSAQSEKLQYEQIDAHKAKEFMDTEEDYVILDAREADEYAQGHIEGAVLLPYEDVPNKAEAVLPDKEQLILVYCRSGRRSKIAAQSLADMGYTNVKEFGGIIDWPYETVK